MADEQQIVPVETAETEPGIASDESAGKEPETGPDESAKAEPGAEPEEHAEAEGEPEETGCPVEMGLFAGPRCGRELHKAPDGVDERPVCLMHSKDEGKQSGRQCDKFWCIFKEILEEAEEGEAHFNKFVFPELDLYSRALRAIRRFDGTADFRATLPRDANFSGATFTGGANFHGAMFTHGANFSNAKFVRSASFRSARFSEGATFRGAAFTQDADFVGAEFTQGADFIEATFTLDADFTGATFRRNASFPQTTFARKAEFLGAAFTQSADFAGATFTQDVSFEQAKFYGRADWGRCRFLGQVEFRRTNFKPRKAKRPSAVFSLAEFAKPKEAVFDDVDLSRALFLNCDLSEFWFTSSVRWAKRDGNLGLAVFEEEILLDPDLSELRETCGPIDHGAVEQIYHQLKKNYDARLDYRTANEFHFGEMEMTRLEARNYPPILKPWGWLRPRFGPEALYRWASDYGNSYVKPMLWLLGFLFLFGLLFPIPGLESRQPSPKPAESYLNVWNQQDTWSNNLWTEAKLLGDSFIASIDTAAFQRNPEYTPAYPWGRVLAILETLLTSTLFALFLLAIRRQFKR